MKKIFLSTVCFLLCVSAFSQRLRDYRDTTSIGPAELSSLKENFGKHKSYPAGYEKLVLATLSYFPELKDNRIKFRLRNHGAPLSSRPAWGTLWRSSKKRDYMVFISTDTLSRWSVLQLSKVDVMAQIGILGHELSHVSLFADKTSLDLLSIGINHTSTSYMNRFEFRTDSAAIAHGLGEYLLLWSIHARKAFGAKDPEQLNVKGDMYNYSERYMSPSTIRRYMDEMEKSTQPATSH